MPQPWGREPSAWTLDGRVMHVTRPPLVDLINLIMAWTPSSVVLGTLTTSADRQFLITQIMDKSSRVEMDLLHDVADQLVLGWFGMPRWTVQEIWWRAFTNWAELDGELAMHGVDLMSHEPARATHLVKAVLTKWVAASEKYAEELHRDLTTEPPRIARRRAAVATSEAEVEAAAFDWEAAAALVNQQRRT